VADVIVDAARARSARVIGVTGAIAVGKSTVAAVVAGLLDASLVATDGFLFDTAALAGADLTHRKGYPESFDRAALSAFLDRWIAGERAGAVPVYSHLHYDVVGAVELDERPRLVVEGLHLGHPVLGVRDRFDLLVHLDAEPELLATWFLGRFGELRTAAALDDTAFLHPYRELDPAVLDGMAMDVWRSVNLLVLAEEIKPHEGAADVVVRLGHDHEVLRLEYPEAG